MPWVLFTDNYDWRPPGKPNVLIAFRKGTTTFVTRKCAADAQFVRRAVITSRPELKGSQGSAGNGLNQASPLTPKTSAEPAGKP